MQFLSFFWCPYFEKQRKIDFTNYRFFSSVHFYVISTELKKIDRTFDLSSKHCFGFYDIHVDMYAYIVVKYVYHIILIVQFAI
jgi:hypothetical protein